VQAGDLWRLDLESLSWAELAPPGPRPSPRAGHAAALAGGGAVVVFGGGDGEQGFSDSHLAIRRIREIFVQRQIRLTAGSLIFFPCLFDAPRAREKHFLCLSEIWRKPY
jgi:hypothetical protein